MLVVFLDLDVCWFFPDLDLVVLQVIGGFSGLERFKGSGFKNGLLNGCLTYNSTCTGSQCNRDSRFF
jgi:hypothetical protein